MSRSPAILLAILLPTLAGGCFPSPDYRDLPDSTVISRSSVVLAKVTVVDLAAPSADERAAIAAALAQGGDNGLRVQVHLPQGSAAPSLADLRQRMDAMGIEPAIAVLAANAGTQATELVFVRHTIAAPDCATMVTPSEFIDSASRPTMAFGCATYSNLTRMLADPADLASPRSFAGADAPTAASAIERFHQNQVTPLRKTTSTRSLSSGSN